MSQLAHRPMFGPYSAVVRGVGRDALWVLAFAGAVAAWSSTRHYRFAAFGSPAYGWLGVGLSLYLVSCVRQARKSISLPPRPGSAAQRAGIEDVVYAKAWSVYSYCLLLPVALAAEAGGGMPVVVMAVAGPLLGLRHLAAAR